MSVDQKEPGKNFGGITPEQMARLIEAAKIAASGVRDLAIMDEARKHMDKIREENRQKFGVQEIGVKIIREFRGELPE